MKRAELNRRCRAVMYYASIEAAPFGEHRLVAPRGKGLKYAEHMGLEVREIFRATPPEQDAQWSALLQRISRRTEKHILMPDPRCIPDILQWEHLVRCTNRVGAVIHFFNAGAVIHRGLSVRDFLSLKLPDWLRFSIQHERDFDKWAASGVGK